MDVRAVEEFVARFVVAGSSKNSNLLFSITTNSVLVFSPDRYSMSLLYDNTTLVVENNKNARAYIDISKITGMDIYPKD